MGVNGGAAVLRQLELDELWVVSIGDFKQNLLVPINIFLTLATGRAVDPGTISIWHSGTSPDHHNEQLVPTLLELWESPSTNKGRITPPAYDHSLPWHGTSNHESVLTSWFEMYTLAPL